MNSARTYIEGVVPIIPTPFTETEEVDEKGLEATIAFAKKADCKTIGLPAFGSEFYKLSVVERNRILDIVFSVKAGLNVIVQCNHVSPKVVSAMVEDAEKRGAAAINTTLPRMMPVTDDQLYKYAAVVCKSTTLPVIIQDYNPGGNIIGLGFAEKLSNEFENFRFIKYEVPAIGPLVEDILTVTNGRVKVFSGWGASYMLEQIPARIAGVMPGIPLADYFVRLWNLASSGDMKMAMQMFAAISPYLAFSLQNLEVFHHAEKQLAVARNIFKLPVVRTATTTLNKHQQKYLDLLVENTCSSLEQFGFTINTASL